MTWYVEIAEYMGEGCWADYPPIEFADKASADAFADTVNINQQLPSASENRERMKVRRVYETQSQREERM